MSYKRYAVLISDVIASTTTQRFRQILGESVQKLSRVHLREKLVRLPYAVTAGDEIQTIAAALEDVPELIFDLRRRTRPMTWRIGVGIADIPGRLVGPANRLTGEAFVYARHALESAKSGEGRRFEVLTAFCSTDPRFDVIVGTLYGLHDTLLKSISEKQWETISAYKDKGSIRRAAEALHVDNSTVWRNLKRGYLWQMEETVRTTKELIRAHFP